MSQQIPVENARFQIEAQSEQIQKSNSDSSPIRIFQRELNPNQQNKNKNQEDQIPQSNSKEYKQFKINLESLQKENLPTFFQKEQNQHSYQENQLHLPSYQQKNENTPSYLQKYQSYYTSPLPYRFQSQSKPIEKHQQTNQNPKSFMNTQRQTKPSTQRERQITNTKTYDSPERKTYYSTSYEQTQNITQRYRPISSLTSPYSYIETHVSSKLHVQNIREENAGSLYRRLERTAKNNLTALESQSSHYETPAYMRTYKTDNRPLTAQKYETKTTLKQISRPLTSLYKQNWTYSVNPNISDQFKPIVIGNDSAAISKNQGTLGDNQVTISKNSAIAGDNSIINELSEIKRPYFERKFGERRVLKKLGADEDPIVIMKTDWCSFILLLLVLLALLGLGVYQLREGIKEKDTLRKQQIQYNNKPGDRIEPVFIDNENKAIIESNASKIQQSKAAPVQIENANVNGTMIQMNKKNQTIEGVYVKPVQEIEKQPYGVNQIEPQGIAGIQPQGITQIEPQGVTQVQPSQIAQITQMKPQEITEINQQQTIQVQPVKLIKPQLQIQIQSQPTIQMETIAPQSQPQQTTYIQPQQTRQIQPQEIPSQIQSYQISQIQPQKAISGQIDQFQPSPVDVIQKTSQIEITNPQFIQIQPLIQPVVQRSQFIIQPDEINPFTTVQTEQQIKPIPEKDEIQSATFNPVSVDNQINNQQQLIQPDTFDNLQPVAVREQITPYQDQTITQESPLLNGQYYQEPMQAEPTQQVTRPVQQIIKPNEFSPQIVQNYFEEPIQAQPSLQAVDSYEQPIQTVPSQIIMSPQISSGIQEKTEGVTFPNVDNRGQYVEQQGQQMQPIGQNPVQYIQKPYQVMVPSIAQAVPQVEQRYPVQGKQYIVLNDNPSQQQLIDSSNVGESGPLPVSVENINNVEIYIQESGDQEQNQPQQFQLSQPQYSQQEYQPQYVQQPLQPQYFQPQYVQQQSNQPEYQQAQDIQPQYVPGGVHVSNSQQININIGQLSNTNINQQPINYQQNQIISNNLQPYTVIQPEYIQYQTQPQEQPEYIQYRTQPQIQQGPQFTYTAIQKLQQPTPRIGTQEQINQQPAQQSNVQPKTQTKQYPINYYEPETLITQPQKTPQSLPILSTIASPQQINPSSTLPIQPQVTQQPITTPQPIQSSYQQPIQKIIQTKQPTNYFIYPFNNVIANNTKNTQTIIETIPNQTPSIIQKGSDWQQLQQNTNNFYTNPQKTSNTQPTLQSIKHLRSSSQ